MAYAGEQWKLECSMCYKPFKSHQAALTHEQAKHYVGKIAGKVNKDLVGRNKYACNFCCRYFKSRQGVCCHIQTKHSKYQGKEKNKYPCNFCKRYFKSLHGVLDHSRVKHPEKQIQKCTICCHSFTAEALQQHKVDKHENASCNRISGPDDKTKRQNALKMYLESYFKTKTIVNKVDIKNSFIFVYERLRKILSLIRKTSLGEFILPELRKAGSHATGLKINKADEFDFNIPLNVSVQKVVREGTVPYIFQDKLEEKKEHGPSPKNMNVARELHSTKTDRFPIPEGYAVVVVDTIASPTLKTLCFEDHLIAHFLQQTLYSCIKEADLEEYGIDLNREAHGPAITMNMHPPSGHQISVDVTVVIDYKLFKVSEYGWPRAETRHVLSAELIDTIVNAGCQLKPKGHEFWIVSFSNCESILLKGIDAPGECRKKCHKLLKRFFLTWRSQSRTGYKTIDSFAFKHLTFWMNEIHPQPGYWKDSNLGECFLDTLTEFQKCLKEKKLFNYFISDENILSSKNNDELDELAGEIEKKIRAMKNINI